MLLAIKRKLLVCNAKMIGNHGHALVLNTQAQVFFSINSARMVKNNPENVEKGDVSGWTDRKIELLLACVKIYLSKCRF